MPKHVIAAAAILALLPVAAQATHHQAGTHEGHGGTPHVAPAGEDSPAVAAFREAADRMHQAMDIPYTGDADVDFARGMIAHHEGAIDMARVLLKHGSDPDLEALAHEIIAAQEREVAFLKEWLASHE